MKEQILKLREEGKTYNEIVEIVGCSKSTVSYYCGENQKEKTKHRQQKNRKSLKNKVKKKLQGFLRNRVRNFKKGSWGLKTNSTFNYESAYKKIEDNPFCYLTGDKINLENTSTYELDHIIPFSKGGKNTLKNMGLTLKEVNRAKSDMLLEDFILLCKKVLEYNGYMVVQRKQDERLDCDSNVGQFESDVLP